MPKPRRCISANDWSRTESKRDNAIWSNLLGQLGRNGDSKHYADQVGDSLQLSKLTAYTQQTKLSKWQERANFHNGGWGIFFRHFERNHGWVSNPAIWKKRITTPL